MWRLLFLALWGSILNLEASPAFNGYLWIDGVTGGSTASDHKDWILIRDASWRLSRSPVSVESPTWATLEVTKPSDRATPQLFEHCASGKQIPKVILELVQPVKDRRRFFQIELEQVTVVSLKSRADLTEETVPMETLSLRFEHIQWTYTEYDLAGKPQNDHTAHWDLLKNRGDSSVVPLGFQVQARWTDPGNMNLTWPADPAEGYRILASERITGPYTELMTLPAGQTGTATQSISLDALNRFFIVEKETE